jgi:hypothetical protein
VLQHYPSKLEMAIWNMDAWKQAANKLSVGKILNKTTRKHSTMMIIEVVADLFYAIQGSNTMTINF